MQYIGFSRRHTFRRSQRSTATNRLNLFNNHNIVEEVLQNIVRNRVRVDKVLDFTHKEDSSNSTSQFEKL